MHLIYAKSHSRFFEFQPPRYHFNTYKHMHIIITTWYVYVFGGESQIFRNSGGGKPNEGELGNFKGGSWKIQEATLRYAIY